MRQFTALLAAPESLVHISDRESDLYDLFSIVQRAGTHFLLRTSVDRLAGGPNHIATDEMREVKGQGLYRIEVRDKKETSDSTLLQSR